MANEIKGRELMELAEIITKREYNWGLVRTRQFTEELVRRLCEEAGIAYTTMADSIEALYQGGFIDEASRVNLHGVRVLGNKAVHEGDNDEGDAKNAYYMYREELQKAGGKQRKVSYERTPVQYSRPGREDNDDTERSVSARNERRGEDIDIRMAGGRKRPAPKKQKQKSSGGVYGVLKWVIPALVGILLIILIISLVRSASNKPAETEPETTTMESLMEEETTTEEKTTEAPTEPPTTAAPDVYRIKGSNVRIRFANDTTREHDKFEDGTVIGPVEDFGQLEISGRTYDFVKFRYQDKDLIVCKDYIEKVE